jgi:hypothetical protein
MQPPIAASKPEVVFPILHLPKLELCFADGTLVWLQQINTDPLKRTIVHQREVLQVDLRDIEPLLETEVFHAAELDRAGVIFFTLRKHFKSAAEFINTVQQLHQAQRQAA